MSDADNTLQSSIRPATVSDGASRSVMGPVHGFVDGSVTTSPAYVDLRFYIDKGYLTLRATEDVYICCVPDSSTTPETPLAAVALDTSGNLPKFDTTKYVWKTVSANTDFPFVLPKGAGVLAYRAVSSGCDLEIHKS